MKDYCKYARKVIKAQEMPKALYRAYIENGMESRIDGVIKRTAALFEENASAPKEVRMHYEQILPCIAFYEDLLEAMNSPEEAYAFYDQHVLDDLRKMAVIIRKILKIPGLYKVMPGLFNGMVRKMFGEAAGFQFNDLKVEGAFAMDMTVCPYAQTCKRYGHFEIAHYFCDSDDITYGNMHPCLIWQRTKTIGRGDELCDFRLYKKEKAAKGDSQRKEDDCNFSPAKNAKLYSFWDLAAVPYDFFITLKNGKVNRKLCRTVADLIRPDDVVLECACGTGMITRYIAERCASLTATDYSEGMLRQTRKKCGHFPAIRIEQADITKLNYPDNSFDKVVAANVIHLLDNPDTALKELMRVCKPGGKIIIPTYINNENNGKPGAFVKIVGNLGADFKEQFTYQTYKDYFTGRGYRNCKFCLIRGSMPCAIALITCNKM